LLASRNKSPRISQKTAFVDRGSFRSNETATFGSAARGGASATAVEGGLGSAVNFPRSLSFSKESQLARQTEQLEKLKSAEYQDYLSAMRFEDNDQKLGNYYARKGSQAHRLIDQLEKGHQVNDSEMSRVLDNSDSEKYDNRPPVPLDDETGNGY
jgi:hypothetical protein